MASKAERYMTLQVRHFVALELLCSSSSFAGFEKRGVKVVSLHSLHFECKFYGA